MITGQLFIRNSGDSLDESGRKLIMVVGVLAIPENTFLKGEHQYTVVGNDDGQLTILSDGVVDLTEQARGYQIGHLLTQPLWRV